MIRIGIDPGPTNIGVAVIGTNEVLEVYTLHHPGSVANELSLWRRAGLVEIGIEEPYLGRNARQYGLLKEIIGSIIAYLTMVGYNLGQIKRVSPAAVNRALGLHRGESSDKAKCEAALKVCQVQVSDSHQASALGVALALKKLEEEQLDANL